MEQQLHITPSAQLIALHTAELCAEFQALKQSGKLTAEKVLYFSESATQNILAYFQATGNCLRAGILLLCEVTILNATQYAEIGVKYLFPKLIEVINDSFDPSMCSLYDQLFAQVISFYRNHSFGKSVDLSLNHFQLFDEASILHRRKQLCQSTLPVDQHKVQKLFVLSRVTIGADVAITSIILSRLKTQFPQAEIVLIGPAKLKQLYGNDSSIHVKSVEYGRHSNLISRLHSWVDLCQLIASDIVHLSVGEYLIFDPDSRFSQLGLLPVLSPTIERNAYFFFPSRTFGGYGTQSLGELTNQWLNSLGFAKERGFPFVAPPLSICEPLVQLAKKLHHEERKPIVTLSLGVGGNSQKSLGSSFEADLVRTLSSESILLLDSGASSEESVQISELLQNLQGQGRQVLELDEITIPSVLQEKVIRADIVCWKGGIGSLAALIKVSDQYIGYDSAGQHIAAALNIPTTTIFAPIPYPLFICRWHPSGRNSTNTVIADPAQVTSSEDLIEKILGYFNQCNNGNK